MGWSAAIFWSESASVDGPVFVFLTGVSPSFSNRILRSCGVELTLKCSPAAAWIRVSSSPHSLVSSIDRSRRNSRSTRTPASSMRASTRTSGRSTVW